MKFICDNIETVSTKKQMICSIGPIPVVLPGTDCDQVTVAHAGDRMKEPVACRVAKLTVIPTGMYASGTVRMPVAGQFMVEMHPQLIQRRVNMVAWGICQTVSKPLYNTFATNWSNDPITLRKNMPVALCTSESHTLAGTLRERWG